MSDSQFRVVSLNCWGLKYVSKYRADRITAIADILAVSTYDIVALQEVWVYSDYELIRSKVAHILPHAKFFHCGALGAGLALFSRFPIVGVSTHPYSLNGSPADPLAGDWFVAKGASSIIVAHPILGQLEIFNTHLFAKGGEDGPDYLQAQRQVNCWEISKLIKQSADLGRYVIAAGDYNSIPTSFPISVLRDNAAVTDAWEHTHPQTPGTPAPGLSPIEAVHTFGITADNPHNSFSGSMENYSKGFLGKRLDYIWYRQPVKPVALAAHTPVLECTDSNVVFTEFVPGQKYSYSDHFGVEATFDIRLKDGSAEQVDSLSTLAPITPSNLSPASITLMIQSLTTCYRSSHSRSKLYLSEFFASLFVLVLLITSSALLPLSWINPLYIILTTVLAWFATTMFYIGFLFGNWEINAVMNVIEELEIHRKALAMK